MSFLSNILKHGGQSVFSGVVGAVGSFVASVIVARMLGVDGTATVAMALWLVFLMTTVADVGVTGTLARFTAEFPQDDGEAAARRLAAYGMRIMALVIVGGLLLLTALLWFYWGDIGEKYASSPQERLVFCALVLICFVVHMLFAFAFQFLRGIRAFKAVAVYSGLGSLLQIGGVSAGGLLFGANGALAGYIVFSLPMLLSLRKVRLTGPIKRPQGIGGMRKYALSLYVATLFSPLLWIKADMLIVDQVLGAQAVGLFAAAGTIAALLVQVCQMICNALLPNIVHAGRDNRSQFEQSSRIAVRLALSLLLPACLIAAAAAPEAIAAIYGPAFVAGGVASAVLCLAGLGSALTLVVASVLSAETGNKVLARNGFIGAILTIASSTLLALWIGLVGAALGRLFAQMAVGFLNVASANRRIPALVTTNWIVRIAISGGAGALVTEATGWWLGSGIAALLLSLAAGGLVYVLVAAVILPLAQEQRAQLISLAETMPKPFGRSAAWLLLVGGRG